MLAGQGADRGDQRRITRDGDTPEPRSGRAEDVPGNGFVFTMPVERERSPAGVAGRIAAAPAEEAETPRHLDLHGHSLVAETGDLVVAVDSGGEEDDDEHSQAGQEETDDETTDTSDIHPGSDAGPPQRRDGLPGCPDGVGGRVCGGSSDPEIVAARVPR